MTSKIPECSICFEHYNDESKCPRLLSCGHSFCSSCLERLLHGNTIDCPTCRNPGSVPTGVEGLLKNFALLDIVNDTPKENVGSNTGSHDCEACGQKHPANFCCLDCKENMCKTAAQFHTRNKASRNHRLFPVRNWKQTLSSLLHPSYAKNTMINSVFLMRNLVMQFVGNASLLNTLVTCVYHLLKLPQSMERK